MRDNAAMPAPKDLSKYPYEFYPLAESAFRGTALPLNCGPGDDGRKKATRLRQMFNSFCRLVIKKDHPHKIYCTGVSVSLREEASGWILRFYHSGRDELADLARLATGAPAASPPPISGPAISNDPVSDAELEERARQRMIEAGLIMPTAQPEGDKVRSPDELLQDLLKFKKDT